MPSKRLFAAKARKGSWTVGSRVLGPPRSLLWTSIQIEHTADAISSSVFDEGLTSLFDSHLEVVFLLDIRKI